MAKNIYSMTGFGKAEAGSESLQVTVEIKTVNHRFKDIRFKMSSLFNSVELEMRNLIAQNFKRGSFDINVSYKRLEAKSRFDDIDTEKVNAFITSMKHLADKNDVQLDIKPTDFLRNEFMKEVDESSIDEMNVFAIDALKGAIENLKESRKIEGQKMVDVIKKHQQSYEEFFKVVNDKSDDFQAAVKERLEKRFEEYKTAMPVDEPRFMQEVIFYLEKMDIHEEINRINAHLSKLNDLLTKGGEVGRQIDFLIQELNRETNTTGSKSTLQEISEAVVQMKVQLEKIREQGLNLE
ncbi:YicC/YloC family endoribonuclease [Halobacteriovorax sp. XZX-3]|uniref:YicC/YloC family endoribonuclease n=1 Tax=unclassified Halobacteriovorax TaxID=2639665 RepID=UPI000CD0AA08|nr:YicC/YloC family endoribonuclease [Halobacteriovorax sp. DA5]POB13881.1 YicC family protein [Halobacteriovorax sp. DA5]